MLHLSTTWLRDSIAAFGTAEVCWLGPGTIPTIKKYETKFDVISTSMDEDREDFVAARGESNDDEWSGFDSFSSNSATAAAIENTVNSAVIDDEWSGFDSVNSNSATAAASTSVAPVSIEDEVEPVVVVAPSAAIEKTVISTFNNDELIDPSGVEDTISFTDETVAIWIST